MVKLFGHPVPRALQSLFIAEVVLLIAGIQLGAVVRLSVAGLDLWSMADSYGAIATFVITCSVSMVAFGLYERACCRDLRQSALRLFVALISALAVMAVVFYFLPELQIWRSISVYSIGVAYVLLLIGRLVFIKVADLDRFKRPVLVLGTGDRAAQLGAMTEEDAGHSYRIVNYVRMSQEPPCVENYVNMCEWPDLLAVANASGAQEVVLAMRERRGGLPIRDLLKCRMAGMRVLDLPAFLEQETGRVDLESMQPSWLVFSDGFGMSQGINRVLKRIFDIVASLILILFSIWILIPTAILIKLTSPGPIFYRQERVGENGEVYRLFKFRSMRNDAEKDGVPQWAKEADPRVTGIGKIIRATRIDEIPQILNVLSGEMSFVGPRPERPFFVEQLSEEIPYYEERHIVKPGITGWAQINYPYGASTDDARKKLEYDLYYVKNFSVLLDLAILVQTVKVVVWQNGVR
ncbi:MAG: TIGR03013 family XrtA/PEP-CTERM system glycosyltransferase [Pseudomonadota bacterium]